MDEDCKVIFEQFQKQIDDLRERVTTLEKMTPQ